MKDLRTPEEKTFIEYLDAVCEDMGMNWSVSISAAASRSSSSATAWRCSDTPTGGLRWSMVSDGASMVGPSGAYRHRRAERSGKVHVNEDLDESQSDPLYQPQHIERNHDKPHSRSYRPPQG